MEIIENKNNEIKIKKIDMTCDSSKYAIDSLKLKYNFFMIINGAPNSGKTNLLINLITEKELLKKKFDKIFLYSPSMHTINRKIHLTKKQIFENINFDELEEQLIYCKEMMKINNDFHTLFIFDDMVNKFKKNQRIIKKMIMNRRHHNISIIMITQRYNLIPLEIRTQLSHLITFKMNKRELYEIYDELFNIKKEQYEAIINYIFNEKYVFMLYDNINNKIYKNFNLLNF